MQNLKTKINKISLSINFIKFCPKVLFSLLCNMTVNIEENISELESIVVSHKFEFEKKVFIEFFKRGNLDFMNAKIIISFTRDNYDRITLDSYEFVNYEV